jgi:hypothetical protein
MSERKSIKINMADFNTTRKKTKDKVPTANGIKIKSAANKPKPDTLKKRTLLKLIRQQQEDRYNKLFGENDSASSKIKPQVVPEMLEMKNEVDKAKEYLNNLKEKSENAHNTHNATIKRHPIMQTMSMPLNAPVQPLLNLSQPALNSPQPVIQALNYNSNSIAPVNVYSASNPKYGCLKNGNLPTYRHFMHTSRNQPIIQIGNSIPSSALSTPSGNSISNNVLAVPTQTDHNNVRSTSAIEAKMNEGLKRMSELKQSTEILNKLKKTYRPKRNLQRKTIRRTYKVGRSATLPKISVLVSNKTIRNNTTTKSQLLKQSSIQDVKKHLVKRGLIKIGGTTPNDVLRKIYESTMLMCGDVQNHNPDNILHNYVNGSDDH